MPQDIEVIRAELDVLRADIQAFFDRIEQHLVANPGADPLKLPQQEEMNVTPLRRRTNAAMSKVETAVQESNSQLAKQQFDEFPSQVRRLKDALELQVYKGSNKPPAVDVDWDSAGKYSSISVAEAREAVLDGVQAAKELLNLVTGKSHYTPEIVASSAGAPAPVTTSATASGGSPPQDDRRDRVNDFIQKVWDQEHRKIIRKDIWEKAAQHSTPRQFQYWQRGDEKATATDDATFCRILAMKPSDFVKQHLDPPAK